MSPKLPRDVSGRQLIKALVKLGYIETRQKGSHIRLTKIDSKGEHHVSVPDHSPLKLGTLNGILSDVAAYLQIDRGEIIEKL